MNKKEFKLAIKASGETEVTLEQLKRKKGMEFFKVPFPTKDYSGLFIIHLDEGFFEMPYDIHTVRGAVSFDTEELKAVDDIRLLALQDLFISKGNDFMKFSGQGSQPLVKPDEIGDYLSLADILFEKYKDKRIHFKDVERQIEDEPKCKGLPEDVVEALVLYLRFNLNDFSLGDKGIDYAKEVLSRS